MAVRIPPHNEEAEQSVIGAVMIDKNAITLISETLRPYDFYNDTNGIIFGAMLSLYDERKPIDLVTLSGELKKKKLHTKVESSYLTSLVNMVPTAANIEHYARLVKEASTKRALIDAGTRMVEMGFVEEDIKAILDHAESSVFSISQGHIVKGFISLKEALSITYDKMEELHKTGSDLRGVRTGFSALDSMMSGMQDSNLIILAARPGQGKTAMAINIAQYVGIKEKMGVGIFSLEMSQEELVDRLLVGQADIDAWKLKTRKLTDADYGNLQQAMGELGEAHIYIDDTPGATITEIRTKARRLQMEKGLKLIIVDYLQLINPGRRVESRVQEVSIVSQALKNLARELKIPVLALSQLSRAVEHRGEKRPQLADLRESGAIEQDADVVLFLYRPDDEMAPTMPVKLLIAKHRNGPTGEIDLLFRGDRIRFYNVDKVRTE